MSEPSQTEHKALRRYPSKLFVETTSRCNLGCFMCVKQTGGGCIAEGDLSETHFAALEPAFPTLEALLLNGVGEPLLHPRLEAFVRRAKELMPEESWVGFQSNGLLLTPERALAMTEAGLDRICLSVDASTPEIFSRLRQGGELPAIDNAFAALKQAKEQSGRNDLQVGAEVVVMRDNLSGLPATLEWAAQRGASFAIVTHILPYDQDHAGQGAYIPCTDAAIAHFQDWQERARQEGVAMERYFEVLFKFAKNPEEQQIVAFVERMKAAGAEQGLFLDLSKLFSMDTGWLAHVEEIFAQARRVAERNGLDLQLPKVVPQEDRLCHFVEDGGAFVSWQGEIHPCYFLWHRYHCFASGWQQPVKPKVFGHLDRTDILSIWNDAAFCGFRSNVIGYDYPYCINCRLAPCDYVQTEAFEQDCHVKGEPCGSCLWCMGLYQCLR
jgi:putative metalloenzyme radical SAM/SPASM domain maturase